MVLDVTILFYGHHVGVTGHGLQTQEQGSMGYGVASTSSSQTQQHFLYADLCVGTLIPYATCTEW